ncbi:surface-adhesin E family protein [Neisseria dentiae]|uniref:surface-adhesin E family protein n=3 Tax=Neisseria dentiae TaxID=194197 RepID=UPI0035A031A9
MNAFRFSAAAAVALLLAACAGTSGPSVSGSWDKIGTTSNGNIRAYIDKASIRKNGNLVTFRDRKVVQKTDEERYVNTPKYKTAVGTWEMHCTNKTYRLTALQLLDEKGTVLLNQTYTAAGIRPMSIIGGSVNEKQFEIVCKQ